MRTPHWLLLLCLLAVCSPAIRAEDKQQPAFVPAVLLSDPHFDPFRDPAKVPLLSSAPVSEWERILSEAPSKDAATAFNKLQADCKETGVDAGHDLLLSSFDAAAKAEQKPAFVLVAGDLVVHRFDCRYRMLFPSDKEVDRHALDFAEKTIDYVTTQLRRRFPSTPVYVALGNNDTGCADYRLDANSGFLRHTGEAVAAGWLHGSGKERSEAEKDFQHFGSYALMLPAPMQHTRLVVLNDLYLSADYKGTCAGAANHATGAELLAWTRKQLAQAKQNGESVWVLAHIPPGVNVYATYLHAGDICHGQAPAMFLQSQALADLLAEYATTVRIFVSGHTHIDEMHLLGRDEQSVHRVPLKTVPSISPISRNPPSFLTARVDPKTAAVLNYRSHTASASTGRNIAWSATYDFDQAYGEAGFNAAALQDLFRRFSAGDAADSGAVENYQQHAATGLRRLALQALWPQYVCSMRHESAEKFTGCACPASSPKTQ